MSILLEALRKSESKQRPHETPTIHTEVRSGASAEPLRTIPMALLLGVTLLLTGWFVWHQYRAPAGGYHPPVTLTAGQVSKVPRLAQAEPAGKGEAAEPGAAPGKTQNRTPVESYQPPRDDQPAPAATDTASTAEPPPPATSADKGPAPATVAGSKAATAQQDKRLAGSKKGDAGKPPATDNKTASAGDKFHPGEPEPIGYWELPDAVRANVPVMKFSVLVYAANPADRFVLIDGQRLAEGDSFKPGLVVKEIRREGVVFSYRLYQFLVER
jgi:general secretion pathway protein B